MRRIQISFIGRGRRNDRAGKDGKPVGPSGYELARYDFGAGGQYQTTFFGHALWRHLASGGRAPDALMCLGTSGSSWSTLIDGVDPDVFDDELSRWGDAVESKANRDDGGAVESADLAGMASTLARGLGVPELILEVIGDGRSRSSQQALTAALLRRLEPGDRVILDITHAYRHLPVLASFMLTALHWLRGVEVEAIYYGAFDMAARGDTVPVVDLSLCADYARDAACFATYRLTGSCRDLASQFPQAREVIDRLDLFENTNQVGRAKTQALQVRALLEPLAEADHDPLRAGVARGLCDGLDWADGASHLKRMLERSRRFRVHREYAKCATLLVECILFTAAVRVNPGLDPGRYSEDARNDGHDWIRNELKERNREHWTAFVRLNNLRNCIAHGTVSNRRDVQRALGDRAALERILDDALDLADALIRERAECP